MVLEHRVPGVRKSSASLHSLVIQLPQCEFKEYIAQLAHPYEGHRPHAHHDLAFARITSAG